jgi:hypothetical protein
VYVAVGVTAASTANTHLCALRPGAATSHGSSAWRAWAVLACVGPWSVFVLWSGAPQIMASMHALERFSETDTPGYFLIKLALGLMLLLIGLQAILAVRGRGRARPDCDA